jgi:hypothetical protein
MNHFAGDLLPKFLFKNYNLSSQVQYLSRKHLFEVMESLSLVNHQGFHPHGKEEGVE